MALTLTGELLAVTTRVVQGKPGEYDSYETTTVQVFADGAVHEARIGRDFNLSDLAALRNAVSERPTVSFAVALYSGRLYASSVRETASA